MGKRCLSDLLLSSVQGVVSRTAGCVALSARERLEWPLQDILVKSPCKRAIYVPPVEFHCLETQNNSFISRTINAYAQKLLSQKSLKTGDCYLFLRCRGFQV